MSEHRDIGNIFKESFEDYKVKADANLEKKMAAMIGFTAIGGGGAAGGAVGGSSSIGGSVGGASGTVGTSASAVSGGTASIGAGTMSTTGVGAASTAVGTVGKVGVISKASGLVGGLVKAVGLKVGIIAKSLGIVKTVGTIAVVGGTSAVVVNEMERSDDIDLFEKKVSATLDHQQNNLSLLRKTLQLEPNDWLCRDDNDLENIRSKKYVDFLNIEKDNEVAEKINYSKHYNLIASSDKYMTNNVKIINSKIEDPLPKNSDVKLPEFIESKFFVLNDTSASLDIYKTGLKLTNDLPKPKVMSSMEKGFYLPNYDFSGGFLIEPMMVWQTYKNELQNDSILSYNFEYQPQLSWQIGTEFRVQKKRRPWFLQIGFSYQNINIKSNYEIKEEYIDWGQSYWQVDTAHYEIVINPPNLDTNLVVDSTYIYYWIKNNNSYSGIAKYHAVNIPIKLGYQYMDYSKPWSLEVALGISPSFIIQSSGTNYNNSGGQVNFGYSDLKSKVQWYAIGHLGFNYRINHTTLFIRPSFKYQINKAEYERSPEKNQLFIFGTQFGVRFKLFKNIGQP